MNITTRPLARQHRALLQTWHLDPQTSASLSPPTPDWFHYIEKPNVIALMGLTRQARSFGYMQIDLEDQVAYPAIAIAPEFRAKGLARKLSEYVFKTLPGTITQLQVFIDPANFASLSLAKSMGFQNLSARNEDALSVWTRQTRSSRVTHP